MACPGRCIRRPGRGYLSRKMYLPTRMSFFHSGLLGTSRLFLRALRKKLRRLHVLLLRVFIVFSPFMGVLYGACGLGPFSFFLSAILPFNFTLYGKNMLHTLLASVTPFTVTKRCFRGRSVHVEINVRKPSPALYHQPINKLDGSESLNPVIHHDFPFPCPLQVPDLPGLSPVHKAWFLYEIHRGFPYVNALYRFRRQKNKITLLP